MALFLKTLIDKIKYGGEALCLENVQIDRSAGVNLYTTIKRW
jgi:hypothetical protein